MANVTVTFTITEFCLYTGVSKKNCMRLSALGVIEPHEDETFDDHALTVMRRAMRLRQELELDWPWDCRCIDVAGRERSVTSGKSPAAPAIVLVLSAILSASGPAWCWPFIVPKPALNDIKL